MRVYLLSLGAGFLIGVVYSLFDVRSPAPPVVALLGILLGEQILPLAELLSGSSVAVAWRQSQCASHVFGLLPGRHAEKVPAASAPLPPEARS